VYPKNPRFANKTPKICFCRKQLPSGDYRKTIPIFASHIYAAPTMTTRFLRFIGTPLQRILENPASICYIEHAEQKPLGRTLYED